MDTRKVPIRVPFPGWRAFQQDFGARIFPDAESQERAAFSVTPLAFDAARAAEGEDHRAELGDCGFCLLPFHPDCASCAGAAA